MPACRQAGKKKGFSSIYEYAAKIAGMSRNSVNEALRVFEKISDKPELQKLVEIRGINAIKPVVTIATKETAAFWAQKAEEMSKNTLETYVREVKNGRLSNEEKDVNILKDGNFGSGHGSDRAEEMVGRSMLEDGDTHQGELLPRKASLTIEVDPEIAEKLKKLKGQGSWDDLMKEFLELREEKLKSEKPESIQTTSRYIPSKIKKYSIKKTNGTCAFPNCTKPYAILHHTKRFALTNELRQIACSRSAKPMRTSLVLDLLRMNTRTQKNGYFVNFLTSIIRNMRLISQCSCYGKKSGSYSKGACQLMVVKRYYRNFKIISKEKAYDP